MIERVPSGQSVAGLELVKDKVHPPPPLDVLALLVAVLQLGPDVVEVVEQLLGLVAAPVDRDGEEALTNERRVLRVLTNEGRVLP